jgi:hypothetical protein
LWIGWIFWFDTERLLRVARWRVSGVDGGVAFVVAAPAGSVASWGDRCDELAQEPRTENGYTK